MYLRFNSSADVNLSHGTSEFMQHKFLYVLFGAARASRLDLAGPSVTAHQVAIDSAPTTQPLVL